MSFGRFALRVFVLVSLVAVAVPALAQPTKPGPAGASARGKYLVDIMSCNDCHTPMKMGPNGPEPDMTRLLSGHPESMEVPPPPAPSGRGPSWHFRCL